VKRKQIWERLQELERTDKWYLSCGDGIIWAPPFPNALHKPGFWDEALVYYHPFAPLFSVAFVRPNGEELLLERIRHSWRPDKVSVEWHAENGLTFLEERFAQPGGQFVSVWHRTDGAAWGTAPLEGSHLVGFTAQPGETVTGCSRTPGGNDITWNRTLSDRHGEELEVHATFSPVGEFDGSEVVCAALRSEGSASLPHWTHTPFWESWRHQSSSGLTDQFCLDGVAEHGLVYAAVAIPLTSAQDSPIGFAITLEENEGIPKTAPLECGATETDPAEPWIDFFESYPRFSCSDIYLSRYYDYRLFGLRLNSLAGGCGNVRHAAIAEGIAYFHVPITYSAQCHMWETRWARDPSVAQGSLLNFLDAQRTDGSLHGRLYTKHLKHTDFYHANWGDAVSAVSAVHEDEDFLVRSYKGLVRYAEWLDRTRDPENCGMYDIVNHFETGQEFMSRYQAVDPNADRAGWQSDLKLKGIDVTVYGYQLKRTLTNLALQLGRADDSVRWKTGAERIGSAIIGTMWDEAIGMFSDVDPRTQTRTNVKAAVCFYPMMTDLLSDDIVSRLLDHLTNPNEFATPFPVPSSSVDDPLFEADATWKGKRHNCPWNGRTWPMTNSHVIEGLLRQWHCGRRNVGPYAADLLARFVRMMFHGGDPTLPNCYEHYNPETGHPSVYRGIDDYQHSWVLDLLIRGIAGLEPRADHILIDPLPMDIDEVLLEDVIVRGKTVNIAKHGNNVDVTVDATSYRTTVGTPLRIPDE
jgi:hypothetical protein